MLSIETVILYAKVSQELSACDINNQKYLNGGSYDERLPILLYLIRKDVEYLYNLNPADSSLIDTTNYLYALCGGYALEAQYVQGNNGGTVIPTPSMNIIYTPIKIEQKIPFVYPTINLGNLVESGTTVLEIRDSGIQEASFLMFINSQKIDEDVDDQLSFVHTYTNNIFRIEFNQELSGTPRIEMRYVKTSSI